VRVKCSEQVRSEHTNMHTNTSHRHTQARKHTLTTHLNASSLMFSRIISDSKSSLSLSSPMPPRSLHMDARTCVCLCVCLCVCVCVRVCMKAIHIYIAYINERDNLTKKSIRMLKKDKHHTTPHNTAPTSLLAAPWTSPSPRHCCCCYFAMHLHPTHSLCVHVCMGVSIPICYF
jgi:hypothetical protein